MKQIARGFRVSENDLRMRRWGEKDIQKFFQKEEELTKNKTASHFYKTAVVNQAKYSWFKESESDYIELLNLIDAVGIRAIIRAYQNKETQTTANLDVSHIENLLSSFRDSIIENIQANGMVISEHAIKETNKVVQQKAEELSAEDMEDMLSF
ncbi:hypothetical protein NDK43_25980 [Neobacillus pocheonensis]|uniref:Uncharacterized protein n=1 Tax=Neobacillus pocheonensis TaxID=363869 RepID=A0ABT0WI45_9BACI|nr:hypothetical protein [Neobacillus pocheonensis]